MATASSDMKAITQGQPSSYVIREAFHESLRDYVCSLLGRGQQSTASESLLSSAFEAILQSSEKSNHHSRAGSTVGFFALHRIEDRLASIFRGKNSLIA